MPKNPRKAKSRRDTRRRQPFRNRRSRNLIVCEGRKTERDYFSDLVTQCRLGDGIVTVVGLGQSPMKLVKEAKKLKHRERRSGDMYDKVFCVFDRDEHAEFKEASKVAQKSGIDLARSWPCFEYWILLHFRYTRVPFARSGSKSPADACLRELVQSWPGYSKNMTGLFHSLRDSLGDAMRHAERAARDVVQTGEPNPSTEAHKLVAYLQSLEPPR